MNPNPDSITEYPPMNRAYCYAQHPVSSLLVLLVETIAMPVAYPVRDSQVKLAFVAALSNSLGDFSA